MSRKSKEFPETVKGKAREASGGVCCFCHREIIMEFHHINPDLSKEKGLNQYENCAPLCKNCHSIYGDNSTKRKMLKEERNRWYKHEKLLRKEGIPSARDFTELKASIDELKQTKSVPKDYIQPSDLLSKIQSKTVPISQCIAEAITIAKTNNNKKLESFCYSELTGWDTDLLNKEDENSPHHRNVSVYLSINVPINPHYINFRSPSDVLLFMRNHPDQFIQHEMILPEPVSQIEINASRDTSEILTIAEMRYKDFVSKSENPDMPIYIYYGGGTYTQLLESIRAELTKRLLELM